MSEQNVSLRDHDDAMEDLYKKRPEVKKEMEKDDPLLNLRKEILDLRIDKGISQSELAEKAGTKQTVISRIERGTCEPTITTIKKIADALEKDLKIKLES